MTLIQAFILGVVQGLTEFFPISSSAHLTLARRFMGIFQSETFLYFDLLCHAGTLLALCIYLRSEIWQAFKSPQTIGLLSLGLAPLIPAYFLLKPLRIAASDPSYLGYFLLITALLLFVASKKQVNRIRHKWTSVLCIGCMQAMALLPGISRSGSTIATARLLGWDWTSAARFSFLLAIPAILGGQFLETIKLWKEGSMAVQALPLSCYLIGFVTSFGTGMISVRFIFWIYELEKVRPFAWYCLGAAVLAWVTSHG